MAPPTDQPSLSPAIVTGGCGFIGSHIVDGILELDPTCEIHVLDIKSANLVDGVKYHTVDITDAAAIDSIFQTIKPKVIFHVATAPALSTHEPLLPRVILRGARNIFASAAKLGTVQALVYTSTSSVVHDNVSDLVDADETLPVLLHPRQKKAYTLFKAIAETEILAANNRVENGGMLTVALRPVSNFGPRDYTQMGKIVDNIRAGRGRYQIGDGKNLYSFTYVANTVHAHLLAATALVRAYGRTPPRSGEDQNGESTRVDGQAFNITNDEDWPFWEYQRAVAASIGQPIDPASIVVIPFWLAVSMAWLSEWIKWIVTLGRGKSDVTWEAMYYVAHHRTLTCEKAKSVLGYKPQVSMQEGLDIAGRWFVELEGKKEK